MNYFDLMIRRSRQAPAPAIPSDFVFYAPLASDYNDHSTTGRTATIDDWGGATISLTTKNGLGCAYIPHGAKLKYSKENVVVGNNARTFSLWYFPVTYDIPGFVGLMGIGGGDSATSFEIVNSGGNVSFGGYYTDIVSSVPYNFRWNHVAITYDGTTVKIYKDGVFVDSGDINLNTASTDVVIGGRPWETGEEVDGWYSTARIYNRCLSEAEIQQLAGEYEFTYDATIEDSSLDFYPGYETKQITYDTYGYAPTFEILTGTLPNEITFNTATGEFSGTAPLDADHTYNLTVKVSAPHCTPATGNVTLYTHATARISIVSENVTFIRDENDSFDISYSSDEPVTFAVESGYALPSGITLSGSTFHSDGSTTAGSYTVLVRGTSEHNATGSTGTFYFTVQANVITLTTEPIRLYADAGTQTKALKYNSKVSITPVFTLTGTLPAGVTFNSNTGVFTSDGTQSASASATVSVTVASSTGLSTPDTQSMQVIVEMVSPSFPENYEFRAPLSNGLDDIMGRTGTVIVDSGENNTSQTSYEGVACTYVPSNNRISYQDGYINLGDEPRSMSIWVRPTFTDDTWNACFSYGDNVELGLSMMGYRNGYTAASSFYWFDCESDAQLMQGWNHLCMTYDNNAGELKIYLNGNLAHTAYGSNVNTVDNRICIAGRSSEYDNYCENAYFADARIYNECLTSQQVATLYSNGVNN